MIASRAFDARHIGVDSLEREIDVNERMSTPRWLSFASSVNLIHVFVSPSSIRKVDCDENRSLVLSLPSDFYQREFDENKGIILPLSLRKYFTSIKGR